MAGRTTRSKKQTFQPQLNPQSRANWTTPLTKILVDLMVDQVIKGNKPNKLFGKKAWTTISSSFYKQTGLNWDMDQLKSRHAVLRKQYFNVKSLLASKNFRWDQSTGAIVAKTESWEKYIKEHPDAETLRSNGFPFYKQLCTIYSETATICEIDGATEQKEAASASIPIPSSSNDEMSSSESEDVKEADKQIQNQYGAGSADVGRKRGRQGVNNLIAKGIVEMAFAAKLTATAIKKYNERFSIASCVKALDELQGISEEVYFAALDLFNNRPARETFLSLKVDKRLPWLYSKCSSHPNS